MAFQKNLEGVCEPKQFENSFTTVYWGAEGSEFTYKEFHTIFWMFL